MFIARTLSLLSFFLVFVFSSPAWSGVSDAEPGFSGPAKVSPFQGFYGGIDGAFVSSKAKGKVGPLRVNIPSMGNVVLLQGPFSFGGTDNIAGGALFAGYGFVFGERFFAGAEIAGSYGSYDNTKAFNSPNFDSDIDITEGFFGTAARFGFLLQRNLMLYSNVGWARSWVEAKGRVKTASFGFPHPQSGGSITAVLNQPVKTDLVFDGISFGGGIEYGLGDVIGVPGMRVRLAYTRIEQGKERFSYEADGLSREPIRLEPEFPVSRIRILHEKIRAEADASVNVFSLAVLYGF